MIDVEKVRIRITELFRKAGLAVYNNPQDAIASISGVLEWKKYAGRVVAGNTPSSKPQLAEGGKG
jgi:hypothetical protein